LCTKTVELKTNNALFNVENEGDLFKSLASVTPFCVNLIKAGEIYFETGAGI